MRVPAQRGFTYLGILAAIVIMGIMLTAVARVWSLHEQRERERQLLFIGNEIRVAIARYYLVGRHFPLALSDLVQDDRSSVPRRFLRKLYKDPMTGAADWTLLPAWDGGIMGVASSSQRAPIKRANFVPADETFADSDCYCKWQFVYVPARGRWQLPQAGPAPGVPSSKP